MQIIRVFTFVFVLAQVNHSWAQFGVSLIGAIPQEVVDANIQADLNDNKEIDVRNLQYTSDLELVVKGNDQIIIDNQGVKTTIEGVQFKLGSEKVFSQRDLNFLRNRFPRRFFRDSLVGSEFRTFGPEDQTDRGCNIIFAPSLGPNHLRNNHRSKVLAFRLEKALEGGRNFVQMTVGGSENSVVEIHCFSPEDMSIAHLNELLEGLFSLEHKTMDLLNDGSRQRFPIFYDVELKRGEISCNDESVKKRFVKEIYKKEIKNVKKGKGDYNQGLRAFIYETGFACALDKGQIDLASEEAADNLVAISRGDDEKRVCRGGIYIGCARPLLGPDTDLPAEVNDSVLSKEPGSYYETLFPQTQKDQSNQQ